MRITACLLFLLTACAGAPGTRPPAYPPPQQGQALHQQAQLAATGAPGPIAALRAAGPAGLDALLGALDAETDPARRGRLRAAVDQVARQRDAHVSRLYWYTDLAAAQRAAQAAGRPILSLRMLGDLGDELSCANSRFFRTTLYADPAVAAVLRAQFILHWSSERPAPLMTIDFGDGRKIQRTVTGNSIHYVLDTTGRPVDAIPGLYAPAVFLQVLQRAEQLARETAQLPARARAQALRQAHAARLEALRLAWSEERGGPLPEALRGGPRPAALQAVPIALAKAVVEMPMVRAMALPPPPPPSPSPELPAARLLGEVRLAAPSIALMREKRPMDWTAGRPAPISEAQFAALVQRFEHSMAEDTVKNEFTLHPRILGWLMEQPAQTLAELNRRVYAELFLTPKDDPWLGLVPPLSYSGLADDGLVSGR